MSVTFPNESRSYDARQRVVHFWGYDRSMEKSFSVSADALQRLQPDLAADESGLLGAFDANRELIYRTAAKVYAGRARGNYELDVSNF